MRGKGRDIVVIGTSAGGVEVLDKLIGQLPSDLPAAIFITQHMAPESSGSALLSVLGKYKAFACKLAVAGERFEKGRIYIAPPDHHMLVKTNTLLVTKGARENRYRPAIDPLFRSAAVAHGPGVVGIVLTGRLDDGTVGLIAIRRCGGVTVVQDPKEANYPEMPQSAINNLKVDHCVPVAEMGQLLEKLTHEQHGKEKSIPEDIRTEALIAERVLSDVAQVSGLGKQVPYNCPNCGGVLWQIDNPDVERYRCHTGHSYTAASLLTSQTEKIEETLWTSLRMFEERKNLLKNMAKTQFNQKGKASYEQRARETNVHIQRIREMLGASETAQKA